MPYGISADNPLLSRSAYDVRPLVLGLGIMFAANEVPRIAQQFGLDSSVKVNMMSVVHTATTAASLVRAVGKAVK